MNEKERILCIIKVLRKATAHMPLPMGFMIIKEFGKDPYLILISCLLSLRSRDVVTWPICKQLFAKVRTPQQMLKIPTKTVEHILHPIGFYRRKAAVLKQVSKTLLDHFDGKVPHTQAALLSLPGVGLKTANLVLGTAFDIPALCVDTHVHRISNQLGLVNTKTPEQTEKALQKIIPRNHWIEWNRLLVTCGQNNCLPVAELAKCGVTAKIKSRNKKIKSLE